MSEILTEPETFEYEAIDSDDAMSSDAPFDPALIHVYSRTVVLDLLLRRIKTGALDLHPEFQRSEGVWNLTTRSRLIESLLIRIPIPAFYFDATDENKWIVIDGLQRLSTIRDFVQGNMKLRNLEFLHDLEGKCYAELSPVFQRRIDETEIVTYQIMPGTPHQVKFDIFRRINTGGVPLSAQEIRHALNIGPCTQLLKVLADSDEFRTAVDKGLQAKRMDDRECVLRYLAFSDINPVEYSKPDFNSFLNDYMRHFNEVHCKHTLDDPAVQSICSRFKDTMKFAHELFGRGAFRKIAKQGDRLRPINKALFETWSVNLAKLDERQKDILLSRRDGVRASFASLVDGDDEFVQSVTQGTGSIFRVHKRFSAIEKLIHEVLNDDFKS